MDTDMAVTYLDFVEDRHRVWEKRRAGEAGPWTTDPVLRGFKFTNVYRVLDAGSQFLLADLLQGDDRGEFTYADAMMRCFLYRYNNRPEPWEYFHLMHGRYPVLSDLGDGSLLENWQEFRAMGQPVFGNAYKIFVGQENGGTQRLEWAVELTRQYFHPDSPTYVPPALAPTRTIQDRVEVLCTIPRCKGFMSMQIATDIGWTNFARADENEFVLPGPGSVVGAAHVAPEWTALETIQWAQRQIISSDLAVLRLPNGKTRHPSLMDVQNTFCEFGKYVRRAKTVDSTTTREYRVVHPGKQPAPVLPEHW